MRVHTGEKPFPCLTCHKSFGRKGGLQLHVNTHTGERMLACSACNKSFASVEESETQKPFTCSKCDKRSANTGEKESYADT